MSSFDMDSTIVDPVSPLPDVECVAIAITIVKQKLQ